MHWHGSAEDKGVRGSLWSSRDDDDARRLLDVEITWKNHHRGFYVRMDDEDRGVVLHSGLHFISFWLGFPHLVPDKVARAMYEWAKEAAKRAPGHKYAMDLDPMRRTIFGVSEFDGTLWAEIWASDNSWSGGPKGIPWLSEGWKFSLNWYDALLGKCDYQRREESERPIDIHMPEGVYRGTYTEYQCRWLRSRDPFSRVWSWRCNIEIPDGVPVPGKGTASYNCDDDAVYSTTFAAQGIRPHPRIIAANFAADIMKDRARYGYEGWKPEKGWPEHLLAHDYSPLDS